VSDDLERWAPELARDVDRIARDPEALIRPEARLLSDAARRRAPVARGALRRSIEDRGLSITTDVSYAVLQSEGGVVRALNHGWLTVPIRPGFVAGPGYTTVRGKDGQQYIVRSGSYQLWAVRRREVRIPGNRWIERALEDHLQKADDRVAERLVREVT
jgi:hypothetical protein